MEQTLSPRLDLAQFSAQVRQIKDEIARVVVGHDQVVDLLLAAHDGVQHEEQRV